MIEENLYSEGYLEMIEVLEDHRVSCESVYVYPGIAYRQMESLAERIYRRRIRNEKMVLKLLEKIRETMEEKLLKKEVLLEETKRLGRKSEYGFPALDRVRWKNENRAFQYSWKNKGYDMVEREENNFYLYEIVRSDKRSPESQARRLTDKEPEENLLQYFREGKIRERIVLYLGEDARVTYENYPITYLNVEEFLKRAGSKISKFLAKRIS